MQVALLGPLRVVADDGVEIRVAAPKERAVVELLALRAGLVVSAGELIDACGVRIRPGWRPRRCRPMCRRCAGCCRGGDRDRRGRLSAGDTGRRGRRPLVRGARSARAAGLGAGRPRGGGGGLGAGLRLWRGTPVVELAGQPGGMAEAARLGELRRG